MEIIWDVDFSPENFPSAGRHLPRYLPNSPFAAPEGSEGPQVDACEARKGEGGWDDDGG